ncbi:MAG: hypothetical protein HRT57_17930 [Crocinitomicaceae bacterium]|nr:hypothetical protein [Crocinitomicaceae bacterium]
MQKSLKPLKNTIHYQYVNPKGPVISSQIKKSSLKFVANDQSEEAQLAQLRVKRDSIPTYRSNFAINSISPLLLGVNVNFLTRFGENYRHSLYVPARISAYLLSFFYADIGLGYAYTLEKTKALFL